MCQTCERIEQIKQENDPFFLLETRTGYVILDSHQLFRGHVQFLCKQCKKELYQLDYHARANYLSELSLVAQAIFDAFKCDWTDVELLGGNDGHLTFHIIPRHKDDLKAYNLENGPIWSLPKDVLFDDKTIPSRRSLEALKKECLEELYHHFPRMQTEKKDITKQLLLDKIFDGERISLYDRRGTVIAYADIGRKNQDERILSRTYVHEGYRGKGIGTYLVREAEKICEAEGRKLIKSCPFSQSV